MDPAHKTLTVPNGTLRRHHHHHHHHHQQQQQQQQGAVYRECLKNHAASLGGHSLDGCGEFMASPSSDPSDPTSLTCAACGCHRNFHRRLPFLLLQHHPYEKDRIDSEDQEEEEDDDDASDGDPRDDADNNNNSNSFGYLNSGSAPHMLMALSTAAAVGTTEQQQQQQQQQQRSRKRFRTRFSPEQKERMQELSERLGWRMQKRDEGLVEGRCREIGVGKGVFKVWMHNNKHNFLARSLDTAAPLPPPLPSSSAVAPLAIPTVSAMSTLSPTAAGRSGIINGGNDRPIGS